MKGRLLILTAALLGVGARTGRAAERTVRVVPAASSPVRAMADTINPSDATATSPMCFPIDIAVLPFVSWCTPAEN